MELCVENFAPLAAADVVVQIGHHDLHPDPPEVIALRGIQIRQLHQGGRESRGTYAVAAAEGRTRTTAADADGGQAAVAARSERKSTGQQRTVGLLGQN